MKNSDDFEKEAIGLLNRGEADTALRVLRDGLALFPGDKDLLLCVAMVQINLGNYVPAIQVLEPLRAEHPTWGDVHQGLVEALLAMGRQKQAIEAAMQAIGPHETDAEFVHGIGVMLYERGIFREARRCYQRAFDLNPKHAVALLAAGVCTHKLGDVDTAIRSVNEALRINPTYWEAASYLGHLFYDSKRRDEARQVWSAIPEVKFHDPIALKRLLTLLTGPAWAEKRKALRAQQRALEKARAEEPKPEKADALMEKLDEKMEQGSLAQHPHGNAGWGGMPTALEPAVCETGFALGKILSRVFERRVNFNKGDSARIVRLDKNLAETYLNGLAGYLDEFPWLFDAENNGAQYGLDHKSGHTASISPDERLKGILKIYEFADTVALMLYAKHIVVASRKKLAKEVFPQVAVVRLREALERLKPNVPLKTLVYEAWLELRAALEPQ
ncbi:MAG: tetratricopeptide repeat protein [Elusimicrobiota bacterium]|nr:MAG: tetratricopeptide repeat protein [Elusimicrobiota bacterium]